MAISSLHRYVLRELLASLLLAFFAISIVMILGGIYRPLRLGLSLGHLLKFLPYALPCALPWIIPASLLTACLMTYGRLSADNELVATAACGVPVRYMCYPAFVVAAVLTAAALPLNRRLIPYCKNRQKVVLSQAFAEQPFSVALLAGFETIEIGRMKVFAETIEPEARPEGEEGPDVFLLHNVIVIEEREEAAEQPEDGAKKTPAGRAPAMPGTQGRSMGVYRAKQVRYTRDSASCKIRLEFEDARHTIVTPGKPALGWLDVYIGEQSKELEMEDPSKRPREARAELFTTELHGRAAEQADEMVRAKRRRKRLRAKDRLVGVLTEIHRREALAFAPLVLCLVGVPLGIWIRRESKLAAFALAVLVFLMLYAMLVGGEGLAMKQKLPPRIALWAPDAIMGLLGIGLLLRAFRR